MPPKRKVPSVCLDDDRIREMHRQVTEKQSVEGYKEFVDSVGAILEELERKRSKPVTTSASKLDDLMDTVMKFGLDYVQGEEDYVFASRKESGGVEVSDWLRPALAALNRPFWRMQSAEALCRTPIDLMLNERLGRLQAENAAFTNLAVLGEKPMSAKVPESDPEEYISGDMDYVVGYGGRNKSFESSLIVVEAKRGQTFSSGAAQCLAYLVGLQQKRELLPARMSTKVYGIVSDGLHWQFLRLDGKRLTVSINHERATQADFLKTVNMIDDVLLSALTSTPHTTPNKVPANNAALHEEDLGRFNLHPTKFAGLLKGPASEYIIEGETTDSDEDDELEVDYYERSPSKVRLELRPVYRRKGGQGTAGSEERMVGGESVGVGVVRENEGERMKGVDQKKPEEKKAAEEKKEEGMKG